ncbi:MAG TPA: ABC transporter permease subunit [Symbiobacteriaceae bacterium]|nr:ABC transporter permease subunit [Symbiobacteriaceae bacterium]
MSANSALQPAKTRGWRSGFGNFLRKEFGLWWSTWRWAKQSLIWMAILNGIVFMVMLQRHEIAANAPVSVISLTNEVFLQLGLMATAIGAIISVQDAIVGERQTGTVAWMLSKPLARQSFVLAKFVAHAVSMLALAVLVQVGVYILQMRLWIGESPDWLPFLAGLGVWMLSLLFYVALTLMLGTLFSSRAAVAGAALGFFFAGQVVGLVNQWLYMRMPWVLEKLVGPIASGKGLPPEGGIAIAVTAVLIPVFLGVALWRFQREEF